MMHNAQFRNAPLFLRIAHCALCIIYYLCGHNFIKAIMKHFRIRLILLFANVITVLTLSAQTSVDLPSRLNQSGQVVVDAPQELAKRNNSNLNRQSADQPRKQNAKPEKKADDKEDKLNEIEDETRDRDKDKEKEKSDRPKQPKRERTTQQTIQARSVGYRIQAYTDNNQRTAKAAAQARARAIAMKFPQYRFYISYNAPSWRLRIGDFKSQSEAQAALARIRSVFPSYAREMTIVRDHINVWQ